MHSALCNPSSNHRRGGAHLPAFGSTHRLPKIAFSSGAARSHPHHDPMSGAAAHHHRKRRRDCARDSFSSPTRRRRRRQLSGASPFPAVRPFCIRFVVAAAHRRSDSSHLASTPCLRRHRSAAASLSPAASPPSAHSSSATSSQPPLIHSLPPPPPQCSSVAVPSRLPALRPFVLRYILAAGTSAPRRRRKPAVVDMGNTFSWISGNSTGNDGLEAYRGLVKGSREVGDLTVATKALVYRPKEDLAELFTPLTNKEETEVKNWLYGSGYSKHILVMHEPSNIDITLEKLRCLRPHGWLNDEVINLYLELLKERADREPERFLKCHFFNTFFYKKLVCGKIGYDYDSVRRWTTLKKLGYGLAECDKIFVPLHRDIHWCLVVINMKGRTRTIQYLDSLGGIDHAVLRILARYIMDELKDKSNIEIDTSFLLEEVPDSLPLQQNGYAYDIMIWVPVYHLGTLLWIVPKSSYQMLNIITVHYSNFSTQLLWYVATSRPGHT